MADAMLEKGGGGIARRGAETGLRRRDASLPPCVAAVCPLSMMGDAHPDVARQSMAMLPLRLDSPSVGC